MITHRLGTSDAGEPMVTVTVTGELDLYRLACHMRLHGPVEFARVGRSVWACLQKRMGTAKFDRFDHRLTGGLARSLSLQGKDKLS